MWKSGCAQPGVHAGVPQYGFALMPCVLAPAVHDFTANALTESPEKRDKSL